MKILPYEKLHFLGPPAFRICLALKEKPMKSITVGFQVVCFGFATKKNVGSYNEAIIIIFEPLRDGEMYPIVDILAL